MDSSNGVARSLERRNNRPAMAVQDIYPGIIPRRFKPEDLDKIMQACLLLEQLRNLGFPSYELEHFSEMIKRRHIVSTLDTPITDLNPVEEHFIDSVNNYYNNIVTSEETPNVTVPDPSLVQALARARDLARTLSQAQARAMVNNPELFRKDERRQRQE